MTSACSGEKTPTEVSRPDIWHGGLCSPKVAGSLRAVADVVKFKVGCGCGCDSSAGVVWREEVEVEVEVEELSFH